MKEDFIAAVGGICLEKGVKMVDVPDFVKNFVEN